MPNIAEELERLASLRDRGILTAAEFEDQKRHLLNPVNGVPEPAPAPPHRDRPAAPTRGGGGKKMGYIAAGLLGLAGLAWVTGHLDVPGGSVRAEDFAVDSHRSVAAAGGDAAEGISMTRDAAVGAPYGSAGPRSCSPRNVPADGPPSTAQITAYVICSREGVSSDALFLMDNVAVTAVSKARSYDPHEIYASGAVDVTKPIFHIQGNLESYLCGRVATPEQLAVNIGTPAGKTCVHYTERNATGSCYMDTFGNWACTMVDRSAEQPDGKEIGPPA